MSRPKTRRNPLPRKSKLRGKLARLELRRKQMPKDTGRDHFITPGSMSTSK